MFLCFKVKLVGIVPEPPIRIIQELMPLGSMLDFLRRNSVNILPSTDLRLWAFQIADGMNYMANKKIIHRNLAARNILLQSREQAKISDFEVTCIIRGKNQFYQYKNNGNWLMKWMPPETLTDRPMFSSASDVWSFGITLWEMYSKGLNPYGLMSTEEVANFIDSGNRLNMPAQCPPEVYDIMLLCWHEIVNERPTFLEIVNFFRHLEINCDENFYTQSDTKYTIEENLNDISESLTDKILNIEDLTKEEQINTSDYGTIHKGTYFYEQRNTTLPVIIKTIKKNKADDFQQQFLREFAVMTKLSHPNIIKLIGN